jgi:hypothetical protein
VNLAYVSAFFGAELQGTPTELFTESSTYPEAIVTNKGQ